MKKSEHTKTRLADALKTLTESVSFSKISVSDIAECAGMSRKSFYYHFQDKYDLVIYIFETEFANANMQEQSSAVWFGRMCGYLYGQRGFYCNVLHYEGQNCFEEYLREHLYARILKETVVRGEREAAAAMLLSEGVLAMIKQWLTSAKVMDAESFIQCMHWASAFMASRKV